MHRTKKTLLNLFVGCLYLVTKFENVSISSITCGWVRLLRGGEGQSGRPLDGLALRLVLLRHHLQGFKFFTGITGKLFYW